MLHAAACTLTEKELDGIGTMRKQLASRELGIKPTGESEEAMLVRFLRARRGSVAKAVDMLQADLVWRRAHRGRRLRSSKKLVRATGMIVVTPSLRGGQSTAFRPSG